MTPPDPDTLRPLAALLAKRLEVIADRERRETNPTAHLEALKTVSEEIIAEQTRLSGSLPPRLNHFLDQCSYEKALAFIQTSLNP